MFEQNVSKRSKSTYTFPYFIHGHTESELRTEKNAEIVKYVLTDGFLKDRMNEYVLNVYIRTSVSGFNETMNTNPFEWEVYGLANIKSAKKRILVTETRTARNKAIRSKVKTAIKKVDAAVVAQDKEAAKAALLAATSEIDKATAKGVYHKNTASRKVSRLAQAVNKMA